MRLMHGDCLELMNEIPDGSVDLVLCDPPYGILGDNPPSKWKSKTVISRWDKCLPTEKMFSECSRVLRPNGKCVLFSQEPLTSRLVTGAIPSLPFSYRAVWIKNVHANALGCRKAMVSRFEDVCVFQCSKGGGKAYEYMSGQLDESGLTVNDVNKLLNTSTMAGHYFHPGSQFSIPTKDKYEMLQKTGYWKMPYEKLKSMVSSTFNLWQGGKSKSNVLEYAKDRGGYHPTQKPVALLEDLIKTFSNEGDNVLDFTMGSGSTGVACVNTGRNFIGIELDKGYFEIAEKRILEAMGRLD